MHCLQTTGGGYGAAPTLVAAGGVPTTGVAHHGPISGTVPSGPAFQGHQAATGAAAGGVPAAGVAHHGPISGSGPASQGHQAATGAAAGGVPAAGVAHHGPISGTVPSGPAFQGDQVAPNYPSGTSRHSAIPDSLPGNQTAGGSDVAAGGLTGRSTHQTGAGIGQSSGAVLGGSNVAMPGANAGVHLHAVSADMPIIISALCPWLLQAGKCHTLGLQWAQRELLAATAHWSDHDRTHTPAIEKASYKRTCPSQTGVCSCLSFQELILVSRTVAVPSIEEAYHEVYGYRIR